jgi:predicted ATPase
LQAATWPPPLDPLRVRMALHTGPAQVQADGWHAEHTLNRLARLLAAAHGGQVLLSGVTRDLLTGHLPPEGTLRDLGERRLPDLGEPLRVFQLLAPGLPTAFPPLKTLEPPPTNLPAPLTEFIGREREQAAITALLRREKVRLVTLTGPGGIGKTRLGLEAAAALRDEFADGVWLVELAPLADPDLVAATIAATLTAPKSDARPTGDSLREYLREKQALLVLDNFEQVLAAVPLVEALLKAAPRLKVLATSRAPLGVYGEREFLVPPLTLPDRRRPPALDQLADYEAVRLFVERSQAVQPDFVLREATAPAVAEICWRLDGLPLAIELAAARSKLFDPPALLTHLARRLGLETAVRTAPVRQQTLRAAIDWSYQLLTPGAQRLFRRLAVFQGGATLEALTAVCNYDSAFGVKMLAGVESLVEQSLVVEREGRGGEARFGMLETIQEFAREQLAASGEQAVLRDAHARYFLALITTPQQEFNGPEEIEWLNQVDDEYDNLRAVLSWARSAGDAFAAATPPGTGSSPRERLATVFAMTPFLGHFWTTRGDAAEGRRWMTELLAAAAQVDAAAPESTNGPASVVLAPFLVDFWSTRSYTTEGRRQMAPLLAAAAQVAGAAPEGAAAAWALLKARAQEVVVSMAEEQGDYATAQVLGEQLLAVVVAQQDTRLMARTYNLLGIIALDLEDYARARACFEQSVPLFRVLGDEQGMATAQANLGIILQQAGEWQQAEQSFQEALVIYRRYEDTMMVAYLLVYLAHGAYRQQQWAAAAAQYRESLVALEAFGARRAMAECLYGLSWVAQAAGQARQAARLLGAAAALHQATETALSPWLVPWQQQAEAAGRAMLGDATFTAAWAAGQALSLEEAIADALDGPPLP